jgi:hypothetical protein
MSSHGTRRPTSRFAALARVAWAWLRHGGRPALLVLLLALGVGAWASAIAGAPAFASGEKSGESTGSPGGSAPTGGGTSTSSCPSPNPPNQLTLVAGTPQTTTLDTAFATGLQVALSNSNGCAVTGAAGVPITFIAPANGASGRFSSSNSSTTVGADASGAVTAPMFTANGTAGGYTVTASSPYGSVSFSLTNTAAGIPARLARIPLEHASAKVSTRFAQPLKVRVLDAGGNPVAGATVTFTLGSATGTTASTCATSTSSSAGASFLGGGTQATATSNASGLATAPALTANTTAGSFTATASLSTAGGNGGGGGGESTDKAGPTVTPVDFSLSNLAGKPTKIVPGVGSSQSTPVDSAFPIRLAVSLTDAYKNPVPGALVTFSAPAAGGRFTLRSPAWGHHHARISHPDTVEVRTGACGIAVAPPFSAGAKTGGYIVKASSKPAKSAAFALVNEAPGQSPR